MNPDGVLAATFQEAMRMAEAMKADGQPSGVIIDAVANMLRLAWPKGREEPWHYGCDRCGDTGWVVKVCREGSCGRPFKLPKQHSDDRTGQGTCQTGHGFVEPCWCQKGLGFKRQLAKEPRPLEDAVEAAAKTSKPTRLGR